MLGGHVRVAELLGSDLGVGQPRASDPESVGWLTEEPFAEGSLAIAPCAAAATTAGSAPAAAIKGAAVLPGTCNSACSRCDGSAYGLPSVRAVRNAAETASRLLVVSLLVSIYSFFSDLSSRVGPMVVAEPLTSRLSVGGDLSWWTPAAAADVDAAGGVGGEYT